MVDFKEANETIKMVKADSYQKDLLDFILTIKGKNVKSMPLVTKCEERINTHSVMLLSNLNEMKHLVYKYVDKRVTVEINKGNLLDQNVEIIVNAANTELIFGGKSKLIIRLINENYG